MQIKQIIKLIIFDYEMPVMETLEILSQRYSSIPVIMLKPPTSCWSKGVGGKYAYYLCQQKECPDGGKSIPKKLIEDEFEKLLAELTPSPDLFYTAAEIFSTLCGVIAAITARMKSLS